jgi:hypothetical protein
MENKYTKALDSIPRTKEEMDEIRNAIDGSKSEVVLEKAYKHNERVERAKKIVRMFGSEEFQFFWNSIVVQMKDLLISPDALKQLKGSPAKDQRYDPFGQLVQLNNMQGGLEMLESQEIQRKIFEETARGEVIDVDELKSKLPIINTFKEKENDKEN